MLTTAPLKTRVCYVHTYALFVQMVEPNLPSCQPPHLSKFPQESTSIHETSQDETKLPGVVTRFHSKHRVSSNRRPASISQANKTEYK